MLHELLRLKLTLADSWKLFCLKQKSSSESAKVCINLRGLMLLQMLVKLVQSILFITRFVGNLLVFASWFFCATESKPRSQALFNLYIWVLSVSNKKALRVCVCVCMKIFEPQTSTRLDLDGCGRLLKFAVADFFPSSTSRIKMLWFEIKFLCVQTISLYASERFFLSLLFERSLNVSFQSLCKIHF